MCYETKELHVSPYSKCLSLAAFGHLSLSSFIIEFGFPNCHNKRYRGERAQYSYNLPFKSVIIITDTSNLNLRI